MTGIVSLVPSVTETLLAWGIVPAACTRFCEQPDLPSIGGTKNPDVGAIVAMRPDLVVMCDEENRREDADALLGAGVAIHSCSPRAVDEVAPALDDLADRLREVGISPVPTPTAIEPVSPLGLRAFVPIWRRPWMSLADDTYGSSVLDAIGVTNICAGADLRYPEVDLDDARSREPDVVLAPSEPYVFKPAHLVELSTVAPVIEVDGQDLFWWGSRTPAAIGRLHAAVAGR